MLAPFERTIAALAPLLLAGLLASAGAAHAQSEESTEPTAPAAHEAHVEKEDWSFAGPFGHYDQGQLQRGFKVYRTVCASCHSMDFVAFRNLAEPTGPGFSEAAARQIASEYMITDGPNDDGDMFQRPGRLSDYLPAPFPNEKAAALANGGAYPPDLSLIAKARAAHRGFPGWVFDAFTQYQEAGPDYIHALMNGYEEAPEGLEAVPGKFYNPIFLAGPWISMPPPLSDGIVEYTDGSPETVEQYSEDVSAFLMWAAEPKLQQRKEAGFRIMIFLIVFAVLLYLTKQKLWRDIAH